MILSKKGMIRSENRGEGNQTMNFGQVIEYKMRNIFLEKSITKCVGKTILRHFFKKLKVSISHRSIVLSFIQFVLFFLYAKLSAMEVY